jgi:4'-phosphopantetheinyl transferase
VPALEAGETHVWLLDLARIGGEDVLSPEERARADAFRFERHRRRYVAAHAQLREILSAYVGGDPDAHVLVEGANGKPELGGHELRFNLAHSEEVGVCAVATVEVGVDIEAVEREPPPDWDAVAVRFFHTKEVAALHSVAGERGWLEFLRIWTLKEACLKAAGVGLLTDPRSFSVGPVLAGREDVVALAGGEWLARELEGVPGAVAALATAA